MGPVINQNATLSASYKWINLNFTYNHIKDDIIQISEPYSDANPTISLLNIINAKPYDNIVSSVTLSPTIGWWSPQFMAQVYKQWFRIDTGQTSGDPCVAQQLQSAGRIPA